MQSPSLTDALVQLDVVKLISAISEIIKELHVGLQKSVTLNSNFWNEKKKKKNTFKRHFLCQCITHR